MKAIPGYEGLYVADKNGGIWSLQRGQKKRKLKPYEGTGGYLKVNLYRGGKAKHCYVHRLVAETYIPNPDGGTVVNHKDTNVKNCRVRNLEWCSQKENIAFSRSLGNQHKDRPVKARRVEGDEERRYLNIRSASVDLFGNCHRLQYHCTTKGPRFEYSGWAFEVAP